MRPIRLEMEGFTSFRDRTVVDFEDADLFVLTGPTGAGKSSVIDAITFALYRSIPRLGGGAVTPVISQGMLQARVRLDFAVGEKHYTVVQVVGTKPEAMLEDEYGTPLASGVTGVTGKVEGILGIPFEHFTKSVVLPQGEFSEFLHESSGERQKMLRRLLGTELFTRLATRARTRNRDSDVAAQLLDSEIEKLENHGITETGLEAARQRESALESLAKRIRVCEPEMKGLVEQERSGREQAGDAIERLGLLQAVSVPAGVPELADKIAEAGRQLDDANAAYGKAAKERECRQDALNNLPSETVLRIDIRHYDDMADALEERTQAEHNLNETLETLDEADVEAKRAKAGVDEAEETRRSMENKHRAYHLSSGLEAGDRCPVCRQHVSELPNLETPEEMGGVEAQLRAAQKGEDKANKVLAAAKSAAAEQKGSLKVSEGRVRKLEIKLKDADTREEVDAALVQVEAANGALQAANAKEKEAREGLTKAEKIAKSLEESGTKAWSEYDARRDGVAEMQPPTAKRDNLAVAWNDLDAWAKEQAEVQRALHNKAEKKQRTAESALVELRETFAVWCRNEGVKVAAGEEPLTACSREMGRQEAEVKRIENGLKDLRQKRKESKRLRIEKGVAESLARHLGSGYFERWLMEQVLNQLCVGASRELLKLSSGAYSLDLNERNDFLVTDHRNANERRPVKTLSGGETFLASLSLALALSEHLLDLAVSGAARLEALFLDEGFGTLDSDTLDVVISAIEELGSHGRMVGVVDPCEGACREHPRALRGDQAGQPVVHREGRGVRIAVESWAPEYGSPLESGDMEEPEVPTDLDVEMPVDEWRPIAPSRDVSKPAAITHFVDGVRRIEARVWVTRDDGSTRLGICASYAAGVVRCGSRAEVIDSQVRRTLISTAGVPVLTTRAGAFEPYAVVEDSMDKLLLGLQGQLGNLEAEVAARNDAADALLVLDGPISRGRFQIPGALGYVKSHRVSYLPASLSDIVARLRPGERTPIFLTQTTWSRYSWYLRLPGGEGHPWAGVVRCEASAEGEMGKFQVLADLTATSLPSYASEPHKETRAPQNLYPISMLERELRRRLGDAHYINRELKRRAGTFPDSTTTGAT